LNNIENKRICHNYQNNVIILLWKEDENMEIQNKFWDELCKLRFELFYLDDCVSHSRKLDNIINIITAIASSSSIAGWVMWRSWSFIWSFIIAFSQVINAVKIYLPYSTRVKTLNEQYSELYKLFIDYDNLWFKIANGYFTEEQINDKLREFRNKKHLIDSKFVKQAQAPTNKKNIEKAMIAVEQYYS